MDKLTKLPRGKKRTHGGFSYLSTGRLPEHRRETERYLTTAREGLIRDIAGDEESLTAAQAILIDRAIGKLGLLRCIEEFVKENGVMKGQHLAPSLRASYLSYSNSLRLDLQALGIEKKKGDEVLTRWELAKKVDEEERRKKDEQDNKEN